MPLSPGTWLNHYQILGHLGTGGNQSRDCEGAATQLRSIE